MVPLGQQPRWRASMPSETGDLKAAGDCLPEDALTAQPDAVAVECGACGYPLRVGVCEKCAEDKDKELAAQRQHMADLGGQRPYNSFTLDKYLVTATNRAVVDALRAFDPAKDNFYLLGPTGTGKSHLAVAVARLFWPKLRPLVRKPTEVTREARPNGRPGTSTEADTIGKYARCRVLVLDDLGVERDSQFTHQVFYEIIEGRCLAERNGLILTSNLGLNDLAKKLGDDRITSRLNGLCKLLDLTGEPDRRAAWQAT